MCPCAIETLSWSFLTLSKKFVSGELIPPLQIFTALQSHPTLGSSLDHALTLAASCHLDAGCEQLLRAELRQWCPSQPPTASCPPSSKSQGSSSERSILQSALNLDTEVLPYSLLRQRPDEHRHQAMLGPTKSKLVRLPLADFNPFVHHEDP